MELSSSVASTTAQARLLRPPSGRGSGLPAQMGDSAASSGCVSFRGYDARNRQMKVISPISATFQQTFPRAAKEKKKQNVPCYQRQEAPDIEAK